ncbi:hypothetical protein IG631_14538 [Alternaria alternata]|nr:hypothetical protein IG631_14538 [Alternaria alternata]
MALLSRRALTGLPVHSTFILTRDLTSSCSMTRLLATWANEKQIYMAPRLIVQSVGRVLQFHSYE